MTDTKKEESSQISQQENVENAMPFQVILFNDDWHTFDEVIFQLKKAINCSVEKAKEIAFTVHIRGQAIVFVGEISKCLRVSSILEEIALHTQIIS